MGQIRKTFDKEVECACCGKKFHVKRRNSDRRIMSKCWHSYLRKYIFMGWAYSMVYDEKKKEYESDGLFTKNVHFRNIFYRIIGFCKPTRWIYYELLEFFTYNIWPKKW